MSDGISSAGILIKRGDGSSSEAFTTIAEVVDINGPNQTKETVELTPLNAPNRYRRFGSHFRDGGEVSIEANWTRDGYVDMKEDFDRNVAWNYQIVFPDAGATTLEFAAIVTALGSAAPRDDRIGMPVTFKVDGEPTLSS